MADLPAGFGHEQAGVRPVLALADITEKGMAIVIPVSKNLDMEGFVYGHSVSPTKENGLDLDSVALVFQIRSLDKNRFKHRIGKMDEAGMKVIDALIKEMLKLDAPAQTSVESMNYKA